MVENYHHGMASVTTEDIAIQKVSSGLILPHQKKKKSLSLLRVHYLSCMLANVTDIVCLNLQDTALGNRWFP